MEPLTATINGFQVPATRNATNFNNPQGTPTPAPQLPNNQIQSQVITPAALKPEPQINIPVAPVVPQVAPTFTNEADRILQQSQIPLSETQTQSRNLDAKIFNALANLTGQEQALADEQAKLGIGQSKQQLQDISSQILKKIAEVNQDDIRLIQSTSKLEQQKIPIEFITGQQQSVERDARIARALKMSEVGVLNASALALQGNIALAMETAKQAVDLKYAPYKEEIELWKAQKESIKDTVTSEESERLKKMELKANLALKDLENRQKNEEALQSMLVTASSQNAPIDLLNRAKNAKTPSEAAMILGQYAGDFYKTELLKQQIATEKAQRSKIYADMTATEQAKQSPEVEAWVNNINSGKAKLSDVPAKLKSLVSVGLASAQAKADPTTIQSSLNELDTLQKLRSDDLAIKGLSGTLTVGPFNVLYTSRLNDWKANMENMLSKLTVAELARVKNTGVTFGALSEGERIAVASAASALNSAKQYEGEGENRRWTGKFNASEEFVREKIKQIEDLAEIDFQKRTGKSSSEYRQTLTSNKFLESLGQNNQPIPGTEYIKSISEDGSINFELPKQP